jgi:hypothetical protein
VKVLWDKVIKPVGGAVLPIAGHVVGGIANKFMPGSGTVISGLASSLASSIGGGEQQEAQYREEVQPRAEQDLRRSNEPQYSENELVPRLKSSRINYGNYAIPRSVAKNVGRDALANLQLK